MKITLAVTETVSEYVQDVNGDICDTEAVNSETEETEFDLVDYSADDVTETEAVEELVSDVVNGWARAGLIQINGSSLRVYGEYSRFNGYGEGSMGTDGMDRSTYAVVEGPDDIIRMVMTRIIKSFGK